MTQDPYKYFRVEARELLESLGKGVIDLEKEPTAPDQVPRLLRFAHTLKGAARVVKQPKIAELAHLIEDTLSPLRDQTVTPSRQCVDSILIQLDEISAQVSLLVPETAGEPTKAAAAVNERVPTTVRAEVAEMDALLDGMAQASVQLSGLRRAMGAVEHARHLSELLVGQLTPARSNAVSVSGNGLVPSKAKSLAAELRNEISSLERNLSGGLDQLGREVAQVREAAERLRLASAAALFPALERIARDAAQAVGCRVEFHASGGEIRLDAQVLGLVQDALVQIVRNAVVHGIGPELGRVKAGKPAQGRVALEVVRRANRVAFICSDDGRGVDLEAVQRLAERKGLAAQASRQDAVELIALLLRGGLTTAGTVTEVSGRGVGLDVVRESISRLDGSVSARTEAGRGTTFEIVVPVSISSMDVLVVEFSGIVAAIPCDSVHRTLRVRAADVSRSLDGESIVHEESVIPFIPLARALRSSVSTHFGPRAWSVVVVNSGTSTLAVGVDRLRGIANVVVRPLPPFTPVDEVVAGTSLDANGNPQMILDPQKLFACPSQALPSAGGDTPSRAPILVIDDSLTTRMLERTILESAGYEVDVATSGEEGLEAARRRRYGLFLVDVEMPGIDGFTFVEQTRADPWLRDTPAILVTSRNSPEDRRRGVEVGAFDYVVKSEFNQTELLDTIRKLVS
ncbi:MAG TPA: response regulator [Planctomycetota bacterium]|nr:response regulator [Planctomycetota bacterium]